MAHNRSATDSGGDATLRALEEKLSNCVKARAEDWHSWRAKHDRLEAQLREAGEHVRETEARLAKLNDAVQQLTRELARLQSAGRELRQARERIAQLERQEAGCREEIDRLLDEQAATEATCEQLRRQEQQLQSRVGALEGDLQRARELLEAYSEPSRLLPEVMHNLLRARNGLALELAPGLRAHLARPGVLALEAIYALIRLEEGRPWSELALSEQLTLALEAHRKRG